MTLGFRLSLRKLPDGRLCLMVPLFYRGLLAAIGVLILLSVLVAVRESERRLLVPGDTVPIIIGVLSLLGGAYHERWLFDRSRDFVAHRFGLAMLGRTRGYRISDMAELELEGARRDAGSLGSAGGGGPGGAVRPRGLLFRSGPILTLWLNARDGSLHRLESYGPSQGTRAADTARRLSEYCGLPLRGA